MFGPGHRFNIFAPRGSALSQSKSQAPYIRQLPLGPMKNFVYLVGAAGGNEAFVIDPGWDVPAIMAQARADGRRLTAIVLTHHHADHINGVPELLQAHALPVYVQRAELDFADSLRAFGGAVRPVSPDERLELAGVELECLHTPGHTPGGQCLHCDGVVFTGDTLFVNACGRCDLLGSDPEAMHDSLLKVLGRLKGATLVYPGHDYGDVKVSTLSRERQRNPYLLVDRAAFVRRRVPAQG